MGRQPGRAGEGADLGDDDSRRIALQRFKSGAPTGWVAKLFAGEAPTERKLVMQRFTDGSKFGGHWHQLLFFVDQKQVLYHEPYGGEIDSGIASCFHRSPGPAAGWALEVVDVKLQSCTHECALWVDFVAEVAVDYVRSDLTRSFSEYLRGCALPVCVCMPAIRLTGVAPPPQVREEITPLNGMRRTCTAMKTAKAKSNAFVAQR